MSVTLSAIYANASKKDGCRLWNGTVSADGYPYIYDSKRYAELGQTRSMISVRRWVWERANGPVGKRVVVLTCRHRTCVEEAHMQAMTYGEARSFAAAAGAYQSLACQVSRVANGRKRAKLDWDAVASIKARVEAGEKRAVVAKEHSVDRAVVDKMLKGDRYVRQSVPNSSVFNLAA